MMMLGFTFFFFAVQLVRLRAEVLTRERSASWIAEVLGDGAGGGSRGSRRTQLEPTQADPVKPMDPIRPMSRPAP
jgi:hypothetical protein